VTDFVRDVDYKPGEIVPHCGCTLDVFVGEGGSVTVSDKPVEHSCAFVEKLHTSNGLTCYRLALGAGHRVAVRLPVDLATLTTTMVEREWQQALKWREGFLDANGEHSVPPLDPQIVAFLVADCETMRAFHSAHDAKTGEQQ
jgi:hypothetical protein